MYVKQLKSSISENEFLLFRDYVARISGISLSPEKAYLIETRLSKMMVDVGADSFGELYDYIVSKPDPTMTQRIINTMTTNETLWFRDAAPWQVLREKTLPRLVEALASGRKTRVRIWCAAVSTGQEVYSTAMCVDDYLTKHRVKGVTLSNFEFFATDISSRVLDIAKRGRYDAISIMRGLDDYYRTKYFEKDGTAWDISPRIRDAVRLSLFDLQNGYQQFGLFDVIFCRYVLIYFSDDLKKEIITKMRGALVDDGLMFTGNYALYGLFEDGFDVHHHGNLTYYSKKAVGA